MTLVRGDTMIAILKQYLNTGAHNDLSAVADIIIKWVSFMWLFCAFGIPIPCYAYY